MDHPHAASLEFERVEDDSGDESSQTTILVPGAGTAHAWIPSVNGSLRARVHPGVARRPAGRQDNWSLRDEESSQASWEDGDGWSWAWSSWASSTWRPDPWGQYLDSNRPGWRGGRANWDEEPASSSSPEGSAVPLPRLLSRYENATEPKPNGPPREVWTEPGAAAAGRPVPRSLQDDFAVARRPPDDGRDPRAPGALVGECQGQVTEEHVADSATEGKGKSQGASKSGEYLRLHSSFPPEFRARPGESWKDYWRGVEFWLASEGSNLPPAVRGSRLMQSMKERAAKIVAHLSVSDVACENGVALIRNEMEKSPIIRLLEHKEVDRKRQKFMRLNRYPGESLESFINRASIYRHENDSCQNYRVGSQFYLGHLLDAARLTRKDQALVKTAAGGLKDEHQVVNAMLELADQLEGQAGYPIGKGEPDLPDEDQFLVQKKGDFVSRRDDGHADRRREGDRDRRRHVGGRGKDGRFKRYQKWKQVFHAILEDDSDERDGSWSDKGSSRGDPSASETSGEEATSSSPTPPEIPDDQLPAEVYAQEYKAKKRVNELKQMRQFFQKGSNPEKTKAWVKEQQKKEPCFLCGKLGHWSQECPMRKQGTKPHHSVHVTSAGTSSDPAQ